LETLKKKINLKIKTVSLSLFFGVLVLGLYMIVFFWLQEKNKVQNGNIPSGEENEVKVMWWNSDFVYSRKLKVSNTKNSSIEVGNFLEFDILGKDSIVNEQAEFFNFQIVYLQDGDFEEVETYIADLQDDPKALVGVAKTISAFEEDHNYYLYYNPERLTESKFKNFEGDESLIHKANYEFDDEIRAPLYSSSSRKWVLLTEEFSQFRDFTYALDIRKDIAYVSQPRYEVLGTDITGSFGTAKDSKFEIDIDLSSLDPGLYQIRSFVNGLNETEFQSNKVDLIISAPLYIAYTMDWEGYDTSDKTLALMEKFSNDYGVVVTQFWNPRIYVTTSISKHRVDFLTTWIKLREKMGDEIGMHLHMHYDMLQAAGIDSKTTPRWDSNRPDTGSDVPFFIYSYEESVQLLNWGLDMFEKQGFRKPISFRAGGWMSSLENLKAVKDVGFLIDSSGRTKYSLGTDKFVEVVKEMDVIKDYELKFETDVHLDISSTEEVVGISEENQDDVDLGVETIQIEYKVDGHWDLSVTTYPYNISSVDINKSGPPYLGLWEFPNNGADSWRYDSAELIRRFRENLKDDILQKPQVLTYISHPHAFEIDIKKLEPTYDYIEQYKALDDRGPVIFTTLEKAFRDF
jgi:hypothetical protein